MAGDKLVAPKVSYSDFAHNVAESGLFDPAELLPDSIHLSDVSGAEAARKLVEAGKLTEYQAKALLERRFADLCIENYEILDRLGAGGMGTVFKARHRRMKRIVALKVLAKNVAAKFADRFQREVETIARLSHPNIVMAFDADECEAGPFLVMEFVNGRDLASEVAQVGPLSQADTVDRILQSARGLTYAHSLGIIHRDIKPGNILHDVDGTVKVADLGLARLNASCGNAGGDTALTQAGTVFGTVDYMSPEQAVDSGSVDQRADVYSLGCTLYFLLTGKPPYEAASLMAVMLKHRDSPIPKLRDQRPDIAPVLEEVFSRMVAKQPEERYQSMAEVVAALEKISPRLDGSGSRNELPTAPPVETVSDQTAMFNFAGRPLPIQDSGRFELAFPGEPAPTPHPAGNFAGLTIVLVEPSRTQAGIIRGYLQVLGASTIHLARSGREALEATKRERVDVIISSMHLTDMTGVQLAQTLLADSACANVGFILATSEADLQETGGLPESPRVVLMPKPFDPQRLKQSILAVLNAAAPGSAQVVAR